MVDPCGQCGTPRRVGARFCPRCGAAVGSEDEEVVGQDPRLDAQSGWEAVRSVVALAALFLAAEGVLHFVTRFHLANEALAMLVASLFLTGVTLRMVAGEWETVRRLFGWPHLPAREFPRQVAFLALSVAAVCGWFALLFRGFGVAEVPILDPWIRSGWPIWTAVVDLCVATPIVEELAFRGFVQARLSQIMGPREAVFVQAAIFAVMHLSPWSLVSHCILGLVFGEMCRATRSLYPSILLHAGWNAAVLAHEATRT